MSSPALSMQNIPNIPVATLTIENKLDNGPVIDQNHFVFVYGLSSCKLKLVVSPLNLNNIKEVLSKGKDIHDKALAVLKIDNNVASLTVSEEIRKMLTSNFMLLYVRENEKEYPPFEFKYLYVADSEKYKAMQAIFGKFIVDSRDFVAARIQEQEAKAKQEQEAKQEKCIIF